MGAHPSHHPTPEQRQPQVETGGDHVKQHALYIMLAGVREDLQKGVHIRVHGLDQVLVHPHGQVPEHAPELHCEDGHGSDHHHRQRVARQDDDHRQQGINPEQQQRLDHRQPLQHGGHGDREHGRGADHTTRGQASFHEVLGGTDPARAASVVGHQVVARPDRRRVGEDGPSNSILLLLAGQGRGDSDDKARETGGGRIGLVDQLLAQPTAAIFPPLFSGGFAPGRR